MRTITVELGERSYPIHIGKGILSAPELYGSFIDPASRVMIVTNTTVKKLYLENLRGALSGFDISSCIIPDGESFKNLDTLNNIITELLRNRFDRHCCLIALGGGVVGDITGFAAACYQRGVDFIQVPTTLLAQVDSSVGGKTAVNHELGKNMIGAFHQPRGVIADVGVLNSLPAREFSAGMAEVIKYGLIRDAEFFAWLEDNMDAVMAGDAQALETVIERSCRNKAEVVAADEKESGVRATLNLGHTFGHAIETALHYTYWLHGEAVGLGMIMAADLSARLGHLSGDDVERIRRLIERAGLETRLPGRLKGANLREFMAVDKKVKAGRQTLILLQAVGRAEITSEVDDKLLQQTLDSYAGRKGTA